MSIALVVSHNRRAVSSAIVVTLMDLPEMLLNILESALAAHEDVRIVEHSSLETPPGVSPDVVLIGVVGEKQTDRARAVLRRWPTTRVLALEHNGRHVSIHELRPYQNDLGQLSPEELVNAVRMYGRRSVHDLSPI